MPARTSDRYCGDSSSAEDRIGASPTSETFGAAVDVNAGGRSLFFVVGRAGPPDAVVAALGGRVVVHLPDGRRALAVLGFDVFGALRRHPAIALAGPVSVDPDRFASFARLVGLDDGAPQPRPP